MPAPQRRAIPIFVAQNGIGGDEIVGRHDEIVGRRDEIVRILDRHLPAYSRTARSRRASPITDSELSALAAGTITGDSRMPLTGLRRPPIAARLPDTTPPR